MSVKCHGVLKSPSLEASKQYEAGTQLYFLDAHAGMCMYVMSNQLQNFCKKFNEVASRCSSDIISCGNMLHTQKLKITMEFCHYHSFIT